MDSKGQCLDCVGHSAASQQPLGAQFSPSGRFDQDEDAPAWPDSATHLHVERAALDEEHTVLDKTL